MELFLDTADVAAIKELNELLKVDGVTTNPSIITKSGKPFDVVMQEIIEALGEDQKLFVQVLATDVDGIIEDAKFICGLRKRNTYVKIPVTHAGLKAIKACKELGLPVLATAIYSADQAFMAALSGADYLAPYVNRMDNFGDGIENVKDLLQMIEKNQMNTKVVAASFKNTKQVHQLLVAGIQAVTIPVDVAYNLIDHPGTESAVETFTKDWQNAYDKTSLL